MPRITSINTDFPENHEAMLGVLQRSIMDVSPGLSVIRPLEDADRLFVVSSNRLDKTLVTDTAVKIGAVPVKKFVRFISAREALSLL